MFCVKNLQGEYLSADPRGFNRSPRIVARFINETSLRSYLNDNHPDVKGKTLEMHDLDTGRVNKVTI